MRALPSKPGSVLPAQNFAMTFEDSIQPKARSLRPMCWKRLRCSAHT